MTAQTVPSPKLPALARSVLRDGRQAGLVIGVAGIACLIPARRVTETSPASLLRAE
jgi:hypothetical protein